MFTASAHLSRRPSRLGCEKQTDGYAATRIRWQQNSQVRNSSRRDCVLEAEKAKGWEYETLLNARVKKQDGKEVIMQG